MVARSGLTATLAPDQHVNLGVGDKNRRGWFRAQVVSHDVNAGQLVLTCFMDRPADRPVEPGERVIVAATHIAAALHSVPMDVEYSSGGPQVTVQLRMAGTWQPEDERRHQVRVPLALPASRARRWVGGAWRDLNATLVDLSSRGVGVSLDHEVRLGERLSLVVPVEDGNRELRVTVEVRHVRDAGQGEQRWRAGGLFRNLAPADHERVIRFIFAELRCRNGR
ncbi:MAG TPA: PilZ domain-containing protein [Chloroflexota bacterium]|jgi:hypothetical protein|nr:PilZ domain-containing protein [Chloroflexota bacterium]